MYHITLLTMGIKKVIYILKLKSCSTHMKLLLYLSHNNKILKLIVEYFFLSIAFINPS